MDLKRLAAATFMLFAATLGVDALRLPVPGHAIWADAFMALTALALAGWVLPDAIARGPRAIVQAIPQGVRLPLVAAAAYVAWAAVSALVVGHGYWKVLGVAELSCVFLAASILGAEPRSRAAIVRAFVYGIAALAVTGLASSVLTLSGIQTPLSGPGGAFGWRARPVGLAVGTDMLGTLCLVSLLVVTDPTRAIEFRRGWRAPLIALFATTLALAVSRSLLSLGFGLALLYAPSRRLKIAAGVALLVPLALAFRFDLVRPDKGVYLSTEPGLRLLIVREAFGTIAKSPLVGAGPDGVVASVVDRAHPDGPRQHWDAHVTWFDVPATLGLPALAALIAFLTLVIRRARRGEPDDPLPRLLWVVAAVFAFESLSIDMEDFRHVWLWLGLLVA